EDADVVQPHAQGHPRRRHRVVEVAAGEAEGEGQAEDREADVLEGVAAGPELQQQGGRQAEEPPGPVRPGTDRLADVKPLHAFSLRTGRGRSAGRAANRPLLYCPGDRAAVSTALAGARRGRSSRGLWALPR